MDKSWNGQGFLYFQNGLLKRCIDRVYGIFSSVPISRLALSSDYVMAYANFKFADIKFHAKLSFAITRT
jgi:hypothetical protein